MIDLKPNQFDPSRFKKWMLVLACGISIYSILFSLSKGSIVISLNDLLCNRHAAQSVVLQFRLPRTLAAFVSGGLLALAGSLMQLLLANPLADPYVLGISGGAATCTLILLFFGVNEIWLTPAATFGSLFTIILIFFLAKAHQFQTQSLLLAGIALAFLYSACISLILMLSPDTNIHSMLFWMSGDLNQVQIPWAAMSILIIGCLICFLMAPGFNLLSRGELEAQSLGLHAKKYRMMLYLLSALFTATSVTIAGCIGFIGLITPHLARKLVGYDHRVLLPFGVFLGGIILTLADTFSRTLFAPAQIPVGIVMTLLGVPIFICLLRK